MRQDDLSPTIHNRQHRFRRLSHEPANDRRRPVLMLLHEALGCFATWKDIPHFQARPISLEGQPRS